MQIFKLKDNDKTHEFEMKVTLGAIDRIKAETGLNLLSDEVPGGDSAQHVLSKLFSDEGHIAGAIYATLKRQLDAKEIDRETFRELIDGDAFADGARMFTEELADFFRRRGHPHKAEIVIQCMKAIQEAMPEATAAVQRAGAEAASEARSSLSQVSSGSAPKTGPSAT
jgi:hypothetical protein